LIWLGAGTPRKFEISSMVFCPGVATRTGSGPAGSVSATGASRFVAFSRLAA